MYAGRRVVNAASTASANGNSANGGGLRSSKSTARAKEQSQQQQFQPKLIATQIVALQCFHYFVLALFLQINSVLYGKSPSIDRIFTDKSVRLWHSSGLADAVAILLASALG